MKIRLLTNLALFLTSMLIVCLVMEGVFRVFHLESDVFVDTDLCTGYKLIPNTTGVFVSPDVKVKISSNAMGFRDVDHEISKKAGVTRILFLGDSFTEAFQVPLASTSAKIAESLLNKKGIPTETISLGISGFSTDQEYLSLICYGQQFNPDIVVLNFTTSNDVSDNYFRTDPRRPHFQIKGGEATTTNDYAGYITENKNKGFVHGMLASIKKHSTFMRFVYNKFIMIRGLHSPVNTTELYEMFRTDERPEWKNARLLTEALLIKIKKVTEERHQSFVIMQIPSNLQIKGEIDTSHVLPEYDMSIPGKWLTNFTSLNKIEYLDLLPIFNKEVGHDYVKVSFPHDGHWNSLGHSLAGNALVDYLLRKNIVK